MDIPKQNVIVHDLAVAFSLHKLNEDAGNNPNLSDLEKYDLMIAYYKKSFNDFHDLVDFGG